MKGSQERLTWDTVSSTIRRAAPPSGCARCGAGAGCSAITDHSHMQTLMNHKFGLDVNHYTFTMILRVTIVMCSKFPWTEHMNYNRFDIKSFLIQSLGEHRRPPQHIDAVA